MLFFCESVLVCLFLLLLLRFCVFFKFSYYSFLLSCYFYFSWWDKIFRLSLLLSLVQWMLYFLLLLLGFSLTYFHFFFFGSNRWIHLWNSNWIKVDLRLNLFFKILICNILLIESIENAYLLVSNLKKKKTLWSIRWFFIDFCFFF